VRSHLHLTVFALALAACSPATPIAPAPAAPTAPTPLSEPLFPAPLRLPDAVRPTGYKLSLRIDPADKTFSGAVHIDIDLATATRLVRLHADGLAVTHAEARRNEARIPLEAHLDGDGHLALVAPAPLAAGSATLELAWTGPLPEAPLGVYRVDEGGLPYVFTQFEPLEARRAFPCFDEPRFKVPFSLEIAAPETYEVVANTLEVGRLPDGGWHIHRFAPTAPLPTYLVAFAVGPFDIVDGGRVSGGRVPFRVLTPRGKRHLAASAIAQTPKHLDFLETWFGIPYPYDKLDFLAVPSFSSSAMENVGLVTYREAILLIDSDKAPIDDRIRFESIISHELAHMWFGNLVTLAWWNDLWLNEGFATWMARKGVAAVAPELETHEQSLRSNFATMSGDSRPNARSIRQPIVTNGDIYNAFDGITYGKGAAVLDMLERWVGPEAFQRGVRRYLEAHAHGIATTAALIDYLEASARDGSRDGARPADLELGAILESYTSKPGVPLVTLDWTCAPGEVTMSLAQRPWRSLGDDRPLGDARWKVPVCARLSDGKRTLEPCVLLDEATESATLPADFCPTFAHPNTGEAGYYRWETPRGPRPLAHEDPAAFAGLLANLRSGIEAGRIPLRTYLDGVRPLVQKGLSPAAIFDVLSPLGTVARLAPEAQEDARFRKLAARWLANLPLHLDLGKTTRERRASPAIVSTFAALARDRRVLGEAKRVTERFTADLSSGRPIELERAAVYLIIYIRSLGDGADQADVRERLWTSLEAGLDVPEPAVRDLVIRALGAFVDPTLATASLDLVLTGRLRAQDLRTVRAMMSDRPAVTEAVWLWMTTHFDGLVERIGAKAAPGLPWFGGAFCSEPDALRVKAFFDAHEGDIPSGLERNLNLTLEGIRSCAAQRLRYGDEARAWYLGR
jgi:alanyl aminopeptidase